MMLKECIGNNRYCSIISAAKRYQAKL